MTYINRKRCYSLNIVNFIKEFDLGEESKVLIGKGRDKNELAFIYVKKGSYKGVGYFDRGEKFEHFFS